ncbi:PorP/SprF family type IX secretion system membrane protein [Winogradskyella bathintestinalis]|uniref:Type IX secretion system membrane protein PorP/SprF n=1 Tax=Winogradskyella bathintestinalis TaxID=3035208 RepID=A0ABT7ZYL0_9FLAO|nr:type IX secretion system membrane protein PorP/SprF [Winogradskyella bathintestinalis]MDN3494069.1 type IX secretion system membrane protein PorP/SprF [Winogradskyella bathintestinalis]
MINKITTYCFTIVFLILGLVSHAQQDPQYTQYMYNMSVINPAYATDDNSMMNIGLLYRTQWANSIGSPTTGTYFIHSAITDRMEGGISIVHDKIGDVVKQTSAFADIAYVLPVGDNTKLSFGIKAGATFYSTNFDGFVYSDPLPDPAFEENISRTFPNVGAGLFFFSEYFYLGFSAPNLLETKHLEEDSGIVSQGSENIHFFLTGGYVLDLSDRFKLKPAFMAKRVNGAPLSVDLTANVRYNDLVEFGLGYRFDDSYTGMVNFSVIEGIRIGYAYDHTISNLGRFNSGSHEIMLLFNIGTLGKGFDKSPRFF